MEIIKVSEIKSLFKTPQFKVYVRDVVKESDFWAQCLEDSRIKNKIEIEVRRHMDEIKKKVKKIKTNTEESLSRDLRNKLRNLTDNIPGKVAQEISIQMPNYLDNNYKMREILDQHSKDLTNALEEIARQKLDQIANEDQYHLVTKSFTDAIQNKGNIAISNFEAYSGQILSQQQHTFSNELLKMKNTVNTTTNNLTTKFNELNSYKMKLNELEESNKSLNNMIFGMGLSLGFGLASIVGYLAYMKYK